MDKLDRIQRRKERKANGKKFKDTGLGIFLKEAGSSIFNAVGGALPNKGILGVVKNLIGKDDKLSPKDKEIALKLLQMDEQEMEEVTKRLVSDNEHQITRLVRPITYTTMLLLFMVIIFLDGNVGDFSIRTEYIPAVVSLFSTMTIFYFGSRGIEKTFKTIFKDK